MAKKTTKFWAANPRDPNKKRLLASFVVEGDKVKAEIQSREIKERAEEGFYVKGKDVTLKSDGPAFVKLLSANFAMSSFILVEVT